VGADDVVGNEDGSVDVYTDPADFEQVRQGLVDAGLEPVNAEITFEADTLSPVDRDGAEKVMRLIDFLEDLDDVQEVYTNADIPEDVLEELG
jgi:transcriptional/translational regulatory protein YebC/TACO1